MTSHVEPGLREVLLACTRCHDELPLSGFSKNRSNTHRYFRNDWCRKCHGEDRRRHLERNREQSKLRREAARISTNTALWPCVGCGRMVPQSKSGYGECCR